MTSIGKASTCMALMGMLLWVGAAHATTAEQKCQEQKCQEQKLKAQGKLELCLKKNSAKSEVGGKPDASATCQAKFSAALTKADAKAGLTPCRYLDNGDRTVTDLNTGLIWEKKDVTCPGAHCYSDTFTWSTGSPYNPNGTAFTTFLYGLNGGTSSDGTMSTTGCFTGHCDWRLPTVEELDGIVDMTQGYCGGGSGACIDPTFGDTQADFYWPSTTYQGSPQLAWNVYFLDGLVFSGGKSGNYYVRAVRGGL